MKRIFLAKLALAVIFSIPFASCEAANHPEEPEEPVSELIPSARPYAWASFCGVPGGIPERTTIYKTLPPSSTAAQISAAIAACPSGQVVFLSAGTYNLGSSSFNFGYNKSGVTVRGAGPGRTIITGSGSLIQNTYQYLDGDHPIRVTSGYAKGSTSIALASAPTAYMTPGQLIIITEDSSPNKFSAGVGTYARDGLTSGFWRNGSASRCFRYMSRIASVSGNTINLATPIPIDFSPALNINAYGMGGNGLTTLCGVESLTVTGSDPIRYWLTDRCWCKDVEFKDCAQGDVGFLQLNECFQFELRRCYFHDAVGYPNQVDGIAVGVSFESFNGLFVDNIANRTSAMFEINGAGANAFLYNYASDTARVTNSVPSPFPFLYHHGPHCLMNLFEGNVGDNFRGDGYHGSDSHGVIFRNSFNALNSDPRLTYDRVLITLPRASYYYSAVGNVLGDPSWSPGRYDLVLGDSVTTGSIYALGFPNGPRADTTAPTSWSTYPGTYPDAAVASTLLRHGNYDYFNKTTVWDSSIASRTIPKSLFYSSKPDFFGACQWPPIGPDISAFVTDIPAQVRWKAYLGSGDLGDLFK
jgi:hypothetical protein